MEQVHRLVGSRLGAALALIIANMDKTKDMVSAQSMSSAIKILVAILIPHTLQKLRSILVASAVASMEKEQSSKLVPPVSHGEMLGMIDHIEGAYFFPFSWMMRDAMRRLRKGEVIRVGRRVIRFALSSTLLAVLQVVLAIWAVWVIARGLD